jgi:hypothetical protein
MMLMRAPDAKKPVRRTVNRTTRGKTVLFGVPGALDFIRLAKKKRVPTNMALPNTSKTRDKILASISGMAKRNWARTTMRTGMTSPQNNIRWAVPVYRFRRILL